MLDNYLNINSIDPIYWGKSGWIFLNSIALTYKPEHKEQYKTFILQLPYILPCRTCGDNLTKNLHTLDDALESKEKLIKWFIEIRNQIYKENLIPIQKNMKETFDEIFFKGVDYSIYFYLILLIIIFNFLIFIYKKTSSKK